jgi:hypothetical protein
MKALFKQIAPVIFLSLLLFCPAHAQQASRHVEFETIAKYMNCGHIENKNYVITNKEDWEQLWEKVVSNSYPRPSAPDVDFSTHSIIAVFQGIKSSSGYAISVTKAVRSGRKLKIYVKDVSPADECKVLLVLTEPFEIILIDKLDDEDRVVFKVKRKITACP